MTQMSLSLLGASLQSCFLILHLTVLSVALLLFLLTYTPSALPPRITPIWSSEYLLLFVLLSSCHFLYSFLPSAFPSLSALISSPLCGYHYDRFHSAFI